MRWEWAVVEGALGVMSGARLYSEGPTLAQHYPSVADLVQRYIDTRSAFDSFSTQAVVAGAAKAWRVARRLDWDVAIEQSTILQTGIAGYQSKSLIYTVHRSTKKPGWWQCTVYNTEYLTINSDTQHKTIADVFHHQGAGIPPWADRLNGEALQSLLQRFVVAA